MILITSFWLISQKQFNYKVTTHSQTGTILQYKGLYKYDQSDLKSTKGVEIHIHMVPGRNRWAVDISGSFHNWSNKGFNYNDYYWKDFLKVYQEMCEVFKFDPSKMWVVNLEVGANLLVPESLKLGVSEIMENILSVAGVCKNKNWIENNDRNYYKVIKGERYYKVTSVLILVKHFQLVMILFFEILLLSLLK